MTLKFPKKLLSPEEIETLPIQDLELQLAAIERCKTFDLSIQNHPELWDHIDLWANQWCQLQDQIRYREQVHNANMASAIRYGKIVAA